MVDKLLTCDILKTRPFIINFNLNTLLFSAPKTCEQLSDGKSFTLNQNNVRWLLPML